MWSEPDDVVCVSCEDGEPCAVHHNPNAERHNMDYYGALARWQELKQAIEVMSEEERMLREGLFNGTFPEPEEGTNEYTLPDGRIVKGVYKLNRKLNEDVLPDVVAELGWTPKSKKLPIRTKQELDLKKYRTLDDEQRAIFDQALTITPGLPSLEVVLPETAGPLG